MKRILWFLILSFIACESTIIRELEDDYLGDQLTINGFISPDSIHLDLARTLSPFLSSYQLGDYFVENGSISIVNEQGERLDLQSKDGYTFSTSNPNLKVGAAYVVEATAPGFTPVSTEKIIIPDTTTLFALSQDSLRSGGEPAISVQFSFQDQPSEDYYVLDFAVSKAGTQKSGVWWLDNIFLSENCIPEETVFSDNCFNGSQTTLDYGVKKEYFFNQDRFASAADSFEVRFGKVSLSLARFIGERPNEDVLIENINTPPPTYTNVNNGFGVVFAQNWRSYRFEFEY